LSSILLVAGLSAPAFATAPGTDTDQSVSGVCARPVAERTGGWSCPASNEQTKLKLTQSLAARGISPQATTVYCLMNRGCWYRYDDFHSDWGIDVPWGYGSTTLGTAYLYANFQLTGASRVGASRCNSSRVRRQL
jgi:hypothetical protein